MVNRIGTVILYTGNLKGWSEFLSNPRHLSEDLSIVHIDYTPGKSETGIPRGMENHIITRAGQISVRFIILIRENLISVTLCITD